MQKYKKRADGRYLAQIQIGYQSNGKPKYKNIYARTLSELDAKIVDFKADLNKGIVIDDKKLTVEKWAEIWLDTYKTNIGYNTRVRYCNIINQQIKPYLGAVRLSKLKLAEVQRLINALAADGYSYSTMKKVKETLGQMFKQAILNGYVYINPVDGVQLPPATASERKPLTENDIIKLGFFCKGYKHGALIMTLLYTGVRRGELLALTWDDINFSKNTISINKAVEFRNNQPYIKQPKTKKGIRTVPMPSILIPYLEKLKETATSDFVFVTTHGQPHSDTSIKRLWNGFLRDYNRFLHFEKKEVVFTMHQFRHTYATIMYRAGVDVKTAQEFLGHSSINITLDIYTHLEEVTKQKGADKLNEFISSLA